MAAAPAAFTQALDAASLKYFNSIGEQPFSKQAVAFLNSYWVEVGSQAEFIFSVALDTMRYADMHTKGISLIHLYSEGNNLEYNVALYFYEKLCQRVLEAPEGAKWRTPEYKPSMPEMMTAIVRKQELREKVDVNFDGAVSFLEYLLYQYRAFCNPGDFVERSMKIAGLGENESIIKARAALDDVANAIRAYETEKARLEDASKQPGVKGLAAKNLLAQLLSSPLAERLQTALIKAEAAVRLATRKAMEEAKAQEGGAKSAGAVWWMNRELAERQKMYGRKN